MLHLTKTGGSSLRNVLRTSQAQQAVEFPILENPKDEVCSCENAACLRQKIRAEILEKIAEQDNRGKSIYLIYAGHNTYNQIKRYTDLLAIKQRPNSMIATVRPAQLRLVSIFHDYWTQVDLDRNNDPAGQEHDSHGELGDDFPQHVKYVRQRYLDDSVHYIDSEGNINGQAWFSSFGKFGGGIPFFMDEVFEGSFRTFRRIVQGKKLRVVATKNLDSLMIELTGAVTPRRRTSAPLTSSIEKAIQDSREIIVKLAQRDAKYDKFLAEWLNDPEFLQAKA